jgi:hypothetical protein
MNDYRRQIELLIASLRQANKQGGTPMRIEMSEIFEPALGILFESINYLHRNYSGMYIVYSSASGLMLSGTR